MADDTAPPLCDEPFTANAVRLSPREWLVAAAIIIPLLLALPTVWESAETFEPADNYRIPYELSNDYRLYTRTARIAADEDRILLVGDSVIWGQYVADADTLSGQLNRLAGEPRFANLGVNGMHPASLDGLVRYFGKPITDRRVVLHWNLLWMSSPRHDLRLKKEFRFNHPGLVPQFRPWIPCYRATASERLGNVVARTLPIASFARHIRVAYFRELSIPAWTLDHPYANPLSQITFAVPTATEHDASDQRPWAERGVTKTNFPWVELDGSLQWQSLRRCLSILEARGNRVFVLVGPFNEHLLEPESRATYAARLQQVARWLAERDVPHLAPSPLPSHLYADASHPIAEGYGELARRLLNDAGFKRFCVGEDAAPD